MSNVKMNRLSRYWQRLKQKLDRALSFDLTFRLLPF